MFNLLDIIIIYKLKNNFTELNLLVGIYLGNFENKSIVVVNNYDNIFLISNANIKKSIACNIDKHNWNDELRISNVKNYYNLPNNKIIYYNGKNVIIKNYELYDYEIVNKCNNCWHNNTIYEMQI